MLEPALPVLSVFSPFRVSPVTSANIVGMEWTELLTANEVSEVINCALSLRSEAGTSLPLYPWCFLPDSCFSSLIKPNLNFPREAHCHLKPPSNSRLLWGGAGLEISDIPRQSCSSVPGCPGFGFTQCI